MAKRGRYIELEVALELFELAAQTLGGWTRGFDGRSHRLGVWRV